MGAPVIAAAALGTRMGRKIAAVIAVSILLAAGFVLTPLIAIPFAIAGATSGAGPVAAQAAVPVSADGWGYPLAGGYSKGRGFGYNPVEGCGFCSTDHQGYDMAQACGATVHAAGPGRVITAGSYYGYGNAVRIDHGGDIVTTYGHMQWGSLQVAVGQDVATGTPLGAEGSTGNSTGCHLHFEVRVGGTPVAPEQFMAARGLPLQ